MISTRIFCLFFLLVSFGLSIFASPIEATDIGARAADVPSDLVSRGGSPCGCDRDLLEVLIGLKEKVDLIVPLFDGTHDPTKPCDDIIAAIRATILLIAKIKISGPLLNLKAIVHILVAIIVSIAGACRTYGLQVYIILVLRLDVYLAALVKSCTGLIPAALGLIVSILGGVDLQLLLSLKFVLTVATCGL